MTDEEWNKINSQNFVSHIPEMKEFIDMFTLGYNIGNCVGTSRQLSYSYNDVDIVSGILPILKGTKNAEQLGGHCWLETRKYIIDTSLLLVIDKSLKEELGYIEEQRIKSYQLANSPRYQARKEYVNDPYIKNTKGKVEVTSEAGQTKKKTGKTLVKGYINRNNQENYGCLNKTGNHASQMAYLLHCNDCGFEYEANGCDIAIRKCPRCMQ